MSAVSVATAFVISAALTGMWAKWMPALGWLDRPNERSSHQVATARGGGLAFVLAITVAAVLFDTGLGFAMVLPMLALACLGALDDRCSLPARVRLAAQIVVIQLTLYGLAPLPGWLPLLSNATVDWLLWSITGMWLVNLWNFMDGIDGIAALQAIFVLGLGVLLLGASTHAPWLIVVAAICGFLLWNWQPAKVFMGDAGSYALGLLVWLQMIELASLREDALIGLLLIFVFAADTTWTLIKRWRRGESLASAHRQHFYQRLSDRTRSHATTVLILMLVNLLVVAPLTWVAASQAQAGWPWLLLLALVVNAILIDRQLPTAQQGVGA